MPFIPIHVIIPLELFYSTRTVQTVMVVSMANDSFAHHALCIEHNYMYDSAQCTVGGINIFI